MYHHLGGMSGGWFTWPFWIAFVLIGLWLVWRVVGGGSAARRDGPRDEAPDAEEILKRRFARGEIGQEEYERRLSRLRH
jgi:putative membrane protein